MYSGLRIVYAISPLDHEYKFRPRADQRGVFEQYFGNGLYALMATYGSGKGVQQHMLAVVYRDSENGSENTDWTDAAISSSVRDKLESGGLLQIPDISFLLDSCLKDRFIDLGAVLNNLLYPHFSLKFSLIIQGVRAVTLPSLLKPWSSPSGRLVVLGDAAHAMAPFLGQGANQAIQDAYVIAKAVARINKLSGDNSLYQDVEMRDLVKREMLEYENSRKLRTGLISFTISEYFKSRFEITPIAIFYPSSSGLQEWNFGFC